MSCLACYGGLGCRTAESRAGTIADAPNRGWRSPCQCRWPARPRFHPMAGPRPSRLEWGGEDAAVQGRLPPDRGSPGLPAAGPPIRKPEDLARMTLQRDVVGDGWATWFAWFAWFACADSRLPEKIKGPRIAAFRNWAFAEVAKKRCDPAPLSFCAPAPEFREVRTEGSADQPVLIAASRACKTRLKPARSASSRRCSNAATTCGSCCPRPQAASARP